MKKALLVLATSALSVLPASAEEKSKKGFYVPLTIGYNQVKDLHGVAGSANEGIGNIIDKFSPGMTLETGIGYDFGKIRTELIYSLVDSTLESAFSSDIGPADSASGDVTLHGITIGAYYDIENNTKFTPYFGGSIGVSKINANNLREVWEGDLSEGSNSVDGVLFFTARAGASYHLDKRIDMFGEVSYYGTEEFVLNTNDYYGLNSFGANIGVRYKF